MSNTLVYTVAAAVFIMQLRLCFLTENRIIRNLPLFICSVPAVAGVGYRLFYTVRNPWKIFVTGVYLYVALVWLAAAAAAKTVYKLFRK
ncbi:MAG: hypothetical protein IJ362_09550 [Oscillospiraceae bacterium]|nr:hypothetical protein [Oscillospiraceae bacterium]